MVSLKYYTGIGSRKTPDDILTLMEGIASSLADIGYVLRSGGAKGADSAFEHGVETQGLGTCDSKEVFYARDATDEARALARQYHPAPHNLHGHALNIMARNGYQVLGRTLTVPSDFVVCWTPDGAEAVTTDATGGTGQAIRIAYAYGIPVFNLANASAMNRLWAHLREA